MRLEHFRGVIWPRDNNRFVVIGMLVTNEAVENLSDKNEIVVDGASFGLADLLSMLPQKEPAFTLGDANSVLTSLEYIVKQ